MSPFLCRSFGLARCCELFIYSLSFRDIVKRGRHWSECPYHLLPLPFAHVIAVIVAQPREVAEEGLRCASPCSAKGGRKGGC
jgi:hypothetical protein